MEGVGATKIRKIIFYLTVMWFLHGFIILGLWKMMYGS